MIVTLLAGLALWAAPALGDESKPAASARPEDKPAAPPASGDPAKDDPATSPPTKDDPAKDNRPPRPTAPADDSVDDAQDDSQPSNTDGDGTAGPQPSQADRVEARRLFRAGARAYDSTKYDIAAQLFDQAYALVPSAALRFSAAQALRRQYTLSRDLDVLEQALRYYRQYLAEVKRGRRVADAAEAVEDIEVVLAERRRAAGTDTAPKPPPKPLKPATGTLQLDSPLAGASAKINKLPAIKKLPHWADLKPGVYQVTVTAPGYISKTRQVRIEKNRTTAIDGNLDEQPAKLTVKTDKGADVLVDGRVIGEGPSVGPLTLPSGTHRIVVGNSGHQVETRDVLLTRGGVHDFSVELDQTAQRVTAWTFLVASGLTVVNAGVFTGLSVWRQAKARDIVDEAYAVPRALTPHELASYNNHLSKRDQQRLVAGSSYVLATLGAGISLLLFELDNPNLFEAAQNPTGGSDGASPGAPDATPIEIEASVTPLIAPAGSATPIGGMVNLSGRF